MLIKTCALVFTSAPIPCLNHWSLVKCLTIACFRKPLWHPQTLPRLPSQDWHCDPRGAPKQRGNPHRFHPPGHLEEHGLRGDLDELDPNVSILPPQGKRRRNRSNVEAMAAKHNNPTEHNDPELTNGRRINLKCGMKTNMMLSWCVGQKMLGWCVLVKSAATRRVAIWAPLLTSNPAGPLIRSWRWKPSQTLTRPYLLN